MLVILIDSVFRTDKNSYPQVFSEECNYFVKEKKILKYIIHDIDIPFDLDQENSDEKNSNKENCDEENCKEIKFDGENLKNVHITIKKKL